MVPFLVWIPAGVSAIIGVVYVFYGDAKPLYKMLGVALFVVATYLQFFSSYALAGLLLQVGLALSLALWLRMGASYFNSS